MEPLRWLREDVDERLEGLFTDNHEYLEKTIRDLTHFGRNDADTSELLIDTLELGLNKGNDETMGLVWIAVILGELESFEAVGVLCRALASGEETLMNAAIRALSRVGEPAFEAVLEMVEDENITDDGYVACVEVLEGIALHDLAEIRERVEDTLIRHVRTLPMEMGDPSGGPPRTPANSALRKLEAAALALARLGVAHSRPAIEAAERACPFANLFLQEALDILEEQPQGIPCRAGTPWEIEFRWALSEEDPGGALDRLEATADGSGATDAEHDEPPLR